MWLSCRSITERLVQGLIRKWPDIRQWIIFLYDRFISQEEVDMDLRLECKMAILEFLSLVRDAWVLPWSRYIPSDKAIMRIISELWLLESTIPQFCTWSSDPKSRRQRESGIFNSTLLISHQMDSKVDWPNVLQVFGNDPTHLAFAAVSHLRRELCQDPPDLECIGWDIHILSALALIANIRLPLIGAGALAVCIDALSFVVSRSWEGDSQTLAARCLTNAAVHLEESLEDLDGTPLILEALKMGLLSTLLKCGPLLPFADNDKAREQPGRLLYTIISAYTVYRSVLKQVIPLMEEVEQSGLDRKLQKGGSLLEDWTKLKEKVNERRELLRRDQPSPLAVQNCHNERCTKSSPLWAFKRCGGCLHSFYCSKECQRHDWKEGTHKPYCQRIQYRSLRARGLMSSISCGDLRFFESIIITELRRHRDRIVSHKLRTNVMELDFTRGVVDIVFDSQRVRTNPTPFKIKCPCENFSQDKWSLLVEQARRSKEQLILVRAYIPGGISRKILLRSYEMKRVLENDWESETKLEFPYRFSLTFTCCGRPSELRLEGTVGTWLKRGWSPVTEEP
ncbi:hypothetical protein J3A83DRAFT_159571 [Scleroderma citrinum]